MTEEELKQKEEELTARENKIKEQEANSATSLAGILKQVEDLTAEVKSFKDENAELKAQKEKAEKDLIETKAINFKLARQTESKPDKTAEEILYSMFYPDKK